MSAEDLERYETEIELQLYKEYRDVLPMFAYVVETERRFYLTNDVKMDVKQRAAAASTSSSSSHDAWVWDMYRPARFVANVRVVTFKDVNVEELRGQGPVSARLRPRRGPTRRRRLGIAGEDAVAAVVRGRRLRGPRPQLALPRRRARPGRPARWRASCSARSRPGASDAFGAPVEAVTATKQRRLRTLAAALARRARRARGARCASTSRR